MQNEDSKKDIKTTPMKHKMKHELVGDERQNREHRSERVIKIGKYRDTANIEHTPQDIEKQQRELNGLATRITPKITGDQSMFLGDTSPYYLKSCRRFYILFNVKVYVHG